ncbi:hypothetical protein [Brevundimonas sp.]|uniref:hypothetical protein n=1 Tax=Brevundimonas sp. TaxID=1871086 RepID=UPI002CF8A046|nr:hypothetical protein [Brevundimonas sp.]HWQ85483.1 hypothetical protein [Brevundimonas sp.]
MAFDSAACAALPPARLIEAAAEPCPVWAAENPDRALALLFVAPRACAAVDVLVSL